MKFSICIPNYNYGRYIGATIRSVLDQERLHEGQDDLEIVIADNASTDDSVDVIRALDDERIRLVVNRCNIGFAPNLERVARLARGDWMIMLSSDDVMLPGALRAYERAIDVLGDGASSTVIASSIAEIDQSGDVTGSFGPPSFLWHPEDQSAALTQAVGSPSFRVDAGAALHRSLARLRNPFYFLALAFPRELYLQVEGYRGARLFNPDKEFHWDILSVAENAAYIDQALFGYRVHPHNQTVIERQSGALKRLVDEYCYSFGLDARVLEKANMTRLDVERAFVEHDIALRGMAAVADGNVALARRTLRFGLAAYPRHCARNWKVQSLRVLTCLGPFGPRLAAAARTRSERTVLGPSQRRPTPG